MVFPTNKIMTIALGVVLAMTILLSTVVNTGGRTGRHRLDNYHNNNNNNNDDEGIPPTDQYETESSFDRSLMIDRSKMIRYDDDHDDNNGDYDDDDDDDDDDDGTETKVTVQIYIESLCIDSKNYILDEVVPTFESPLVDVMDLQIVVFGNAKLDTRDRTVACQHGEAECDANVYQQCAIDRYAYPSRYLPFVSCLYEALPMGRSDEPYGASYFARCAVHAAMHIPTLEACHAADAWSMQVRSAAKTPTDHDHVPWVVVDGVHVDEGTAHLSEYVCRALERKNDNHHDGKDDRRTHPYCQTL